MDPSTISHSLPQPSAAPSASDSGPPKTKTALIGSTLNSRVNASGHTQAASGLSTVISRPGSTPQPTQQPAAVAAQSSTENKCVSAFPIRRLEFHARCFLFCQAK